MKTSSLLALSLCCLAPATVRAQVTISPRVAGSDLGAQINKSIESLPTTNINGTPYHYGTIRIAAGVYTQSTTANVGPLVSIVGEGSSQVLITCSVNGDCWSVRDKPFNNTHGSGNIEGFTLVGEGGGPKYQREVGIHTGDLQAGRFVDIKIDNFLGTDSACFWVDNEVGWFERNLIEHVELGVHYSSSQGSAQNGCTKELRFTAKHDAISFGFNNWTALRFSTLSGQTAISLESGFLYNSVLEGSLNVTGGSTIFSVTGNGNGEATFLNLRVECTACSSDAVGWSLPDSARFSYLGPGITTNGDPHVVDAIASTSAGVIPKTAINSVAVPTIAGGASGLFGGQSRTEGQINESIALGDANWGSGIGSVLGRNIAHPIVWGYVADANCFEIYKKGFHTPLSPANRVATFPCASGGPSAVLAVNVQNLPLRQQQFIADQGTACTRQELALSREWGSSAAVTSVVGSGQTCEWTIASNGTGQAANPIITDTLTNPLPSANTVCEMRMVGGTGTATLIDQTTLSATAPVFTFLGTPRRAATYKVLRRCGP